MNKAQHIGEILLAQKNKEPIERQCDDKWEILKYPIHLATLLNYPDRYRVKPEPKFLYVNMLQEDTSPFTSSFQNKKDAEKYNYGTKVKVLVRAYPMEVPS